MYRVNLDVLKARVKKYAPTVIAVTSAAVAVGAVIYYRKKIAAFEHILYGDPNRFTVDQLPLTLIVHPDQMREVVKEGAILQYWIGEDGEENVVTTTALPEEYKAGGEITMVEVDDMQHKAPRKTKEKV